MRFIAGHHRSGKLELNWNELPQPNQTLVFYMGLNGLETICEQLKQHGMEAEMPIALIEKGTSDRQRVFTGDLDSLPNIVRSQKPRLRHYYCRHCSQSASKTRLV